MNISSTRQNRSVSVPSQQTQKPAPPAQEPQQGMMDAFVRHTDANLDEYGPLLTSASAALVGAEIGSQSGTFTGTFIGALAGAVAGQVAGTLVLGAAEEVGETLMSGNPETGRAIGKSLALGLLTGVTAGPATAATSIGLVSALGFVDARAEMKQA